MSLIYSLPANFEQQSLSLEGKHILLSGADTELGRELSLCLATLGATLILITRKEKLLAPLYDKITTLGGSEPLLVEFDFSKAQDHDFSQLGESLTQIYPQLDGLIHLPTSTIPLTPVALSSPETWRHSFQQHFITPMLLTRALIPSLAQGTSASVIFNTLPTGRHGKAYWGAISTMNAALENLSQTLTDENEEVRFNTLDIGKVNSAIRHKYYPAEDNSKLRSCSDTLVLDFFVYLLSDSSKDVRGQMLTIPDLS